MLSNIVTWFKKYYNNIIFYTGLIIFLSSEDPLIRNLLLFLFILFAIYNFIDFHKDFHRNMKRLESDSDLHYPYDLKKDGRVIYYSRLIMFVFMIVILTIIFNVKHYTWVYLLLFILILIIVIIFESKFEKRTNLRELLFGKDEAS